jgi:hypothetical protein
MKFTRFQKKKNFDGLFFKKKPWWAYGVILLTKRAEVRPGPRKPTQQ